MCFDCVGGGMFANIGSNNYADTGLVIFLFSIFSAYWAQQTNRNQWLWFFLGLLFQPFSGLVMLYHCTRPRDGGIPQ